MTKSSPAFNIPNKTLKTDKGSKLIIHSINQERSATQKDLAISQLENRCSRNSISFLQKVHCGESVILILKNFSFVKTMLFKTLYWNSLIFVSSDTLRGANIFRSNEIEHQEIDPETSFEQMEEFVSLFWMHCKEILAWPKTDRRRRHQF